MAAASAQARQRRPSENTRGGSRTSISSAARQRVPVACARCRKRKIRCTGGSEDGRGCESCILAQAKDCHFSRVNPTWIGYKHPVQQQPQYSEQSMFSRHAESLSRSEFPLQRPLEVHSPTRDARITYAEQSTIRPLESQAGPSSMTHHQSEGTFSAVAQQVQLAAWGASQGMCQLPMYAYAQQAPVPFSLEAGMPHQAGTQPSHTLDASTAGIGQHLDYQQNLDDSSPWPATVDGPAAEYQASAHHQSAGPAGVPLTPQHEFSSAGQVPYRVEHAWSSTDGLGAFDFPGDGRSGNGGMQQHVNDHMAVPRYSVAPWHAYSGNTAVPASGLRSHNEFMTAPYSTTGQDDQNLPAAMPPPRLPPLPPPQAARQEAAGMRRCRIPMSIAPRRRQHQ